MPDRILLVDDEIEIADLIEIYLKNENYTVFKFYTAKEALDCINTTTLITVIQIQKLLSAEKKYKQILLSLFKIKVKPYRNKSWWHYLISFSVLMMHALPIQGERDQDWRLQKILLLIVKISHRKQQWNSDSTTEKMPMFCTLERSCYYG